MAWKLIETLRPEIPGLAGPVHAVVHWSSEYREYRVRIFRGAKSRENEDAFEATLDDARNTARAMVGQASGLGMQWTRSLW